MHSSFGCEPVRFGASLLSMKRLFFGIGTLLLTCAIGISVNSLVLRAAYHFIPDYGGQSGGHRRVQCTLRTSLTERSNVPLSIPDLLLESI